MRRLVVGLGIMLITLLGGCADTVSFDRAQFALFYGQMYAQSTTLLSVALRECKSGSTTRTKEVCLQLKEMNDQVKSMDNQVRPLLLTPNRSFDPDKLFDLLELAARVAL